MQIEALREDILKQMEVIRDQICSGFPKSYEEYKELVGRLRGLDNAYQMTLPREKLNE